MSFFGDNTLEQAILDDVLAWQESFKSSDAQTVQALAKILMYFVDIDDNKEIHQTSFCPDCGATMDEGECLFCGGSLDESW